MALIFIDNPSKGWCHMVGSSVSDLHLFAQSLGIKKCWFENKRGKFRPHYDIRASQRHKVIEAGAIAVERKDIIKILNHYYNPQ